MRRALLSLALAGCLAASFATDAGAQRQPGVRSQPREEPPFSCGTDGDRIQQLLGRRPKAFSPGTPVSFRQEPAVIVGDWTTITLREFTVLGDVETLRFQLYYENAEVETWTRTETRDVAGRVVSVFDPTWPVATLGKVLRFNRWGWDNPRLYWGEVLREGVEPGSGLPIYLRIAPETLPAARVVRVGDDLQYSGNVVNIVMPTFADGFPDDEFGFDLGGAAQRFYRDFQDTYDDLAFVTQETFLSSYQGFHRNVRNEVRGIGLDPFDFTATYGSTSRRLQAAEMYPSAGVTLHSTSSHEIAHQWGDYINWTRLTGITRSGVQPNAHDPLWAEGETLIGGMLQPMRRVVRVEDGWQVQVTPAPALYHPFTMYAMGLVAKDDVPEITLFDDQGQFDPTGAATPAAGSMLTGATHTATVYNVIGSLGERSGPVPTEWDRATVVVSRDRLLSQREMDYWNYFAYRLSDPQHTGVVGWLGIGSFRASTGGRVDLKTDIRPLSGERVEQTFDTESLAFGPRDVRDVIFDQPIPMRYRVGDRIRWTGVVSPSDRSDVNAVTIRFVRYADNAAIRFDAAVGSRGSFLTEATFEPKDRGVYKMEVILFWPDSGAQYPRAVLSPIFVD